MGRRCLADLCVRRSHFSDLFGSAVSCSSLTWLCIPGHFAVGCDARISPSCSVGLPQPVSLTGILAVFRVIFMLLFLAVCVTPLPVPLDVWHSAAHLQWGDFFFFFFFFGHESNHSLNMSSVCVRL